jgi:3-oxoacyl-[acyl-carrier protein] reductase/meso-butanediol dehydrogenase/(S,S)-butanediol dehydrogenase/diacetyl reductase
MGALDSKVAVVTGAGRMRGIGRAIAVRLARDGADVCVSALARDPAAFPEQEREAGWRGIESVAEEVRALGRRALAADCDVTAAADVARLFEATVRELGRVDILVNNAGLALVAGAKNLWETADEEWMREIDVNLHGVFHCCKAAARCFIEQGAGGRIVNISSLAGQKAQPQYGGYTPAKFAVNGLTQMLALELAPHRVTVNAVLPGSTDTDMMDGTFRRTAGRMGIPFEAVKGGVRSFIPLGRQAAPEEIAAAVAYLASPEAEYVTGQILSVDGGAGLR